MQAMKLRERFRRWWSPAQWADDHPLTAHERADQKEQPKSVSELGKAANVDRDFKKPR
jgi:hypothetical protein